MDKSKLKKVLDAHRSWLKNDGGERANLTDADLTGANRTDANLMRANLTDADLTGANLRSANLRSADLRSADLRSADLTDANLTGANLRSANLRSADLRSADLGGANLTGANLSNTQGLKTAKDYLAQFEHTKNGIYVYKTFGAYNTPPDYWEIEPQSFIEEVVNPDRCTECGSGVNFATREWIQSSSSARKFPVWKCLIHWEDMADVVVPFNTDGKARCARLQLIEVVK